jgi:hypothetical protein
MPVIPKDKLLQVRLDQSFFDRFSALADQQDTTVSALVRGIMGQYVSHMEQRMRKDAEWAATLESRRQAVPVSPEPRKPPVEPVRKPESLSERIKAEREAKKAKKQKREDRFLT